MGRVPVLGLRSRFAHIPSMTNVDGEVGFGRAQHVGGGNMTVGGDMLASW